MTAAALATCAALAAGWYMVTRVHVSHDTTWFFHVLRRVRSGEALYRDVFFGAGPAPVWLARGLLAVAGDQVLTLRRLHVLVQAATTGALVVTVQATAGGVAAWCVTPALVAFSGLVWPGDNLYGQLSRLGAAVTAAALAVGGDDPGAAAISTAALGVAMACLSKYTLGVVMLVVVAPSLAVTSGATGVVAWLGVTALAVVPALGVLASRGLLGAFVHRAVRNKRTFVETGTVRPLAGLRTHLTRPGRRSRSDLEDLVVVTAYALVPLAPATAVLACFAALQGALPPAYAGAIALLALVAVASAVPRSDAQHVLGTAPLATAAAASLASCLPRMPELLVHGLLAAAGAAVLAGVLAHWQRQGRPAVSRTPPWTGVPGPVLPSELLGAGEDLRDVTGGSVFLLRPDAATWYLACGLTNPTPFDYPLASTFGPDGQHDVVTDLDAGRIAWCCFAPADAGPLTPAELEEYVQRELVPVRETALGTLYRSPAG